MLYIDLTELVRKDELSMEILEAIRGRRSVRKYQPTEITDDLVETLLEAARWAPSGGNIQPWKFIVVRDRIARRMLKAVSPGLAGEPSAIIVACIDTRLTPNGAGTIRVLDMGASIQNILLAAHALGLGACWIGSVNWKGVKEVVGIPEQSSIEPISLISVGYPAETPTPRTKRSIGEIAFREMFGTPWNGLEARG